MVYINVCLPFKRLCVVTNSKNNQMQMYKRDFLHTIFNMNTYCNFSTLRFIAVRAMIYETWRREVWYMCIGITEQPAACVITIDK
jgi:hypothetical protein